MAAYVRTVCMRQAEITEAIGRWALSREDPVVATRLLRMIRDLENHV